MDICAGQTFGRWTILDGDGRKVLCRCSCGTERAVDRYSLASGRSVSCGCHSREVSVENGHARLRHPVAAGDRFGRWTVLDAADRKGIRVRCECGTEGSVVASNLIQGTSKSCGCWKTDHPGHRSHGIGNSDYRYRLWSSIKKRCYCETNRDYPNYGGRGITVYAPWIADFPRFAADLIAEIGERPAGYTIDRIDNDGNYEPGNLRWATRLQQNNNRRSRWRNRAA